jgi:hypothetical protein
MAPNGCADTGSVDTLPSFQAYSAFQNRRRRPGACGPGGRAKLLTDAPWNRVEPLISPEPPRPKGGRPGSAPAPVLGILFVLKTGIAWADLPAELGCGSGVNC